MKNKYKGALREEKDIIRINEAIDIICDDPNGYHYIGISVDVPWAFNHTTKKLSKEEIL